MKMISSKRNRIKTHNFNIKLIKAKKTMVNKKEKMKRKF